MKLNIIDTYNNMTLKLVMQSKINMNFPFFYRYETE